jgi:hypothetical protein
MTTAEETAQALAAIREALDGIGEAWCVRCKGRGYHHGFGDGGHDPDWCVDCGGAGRWVHMNEEDVGNECAA